MPERVTRMNLHPLPAGVPLALAPLAEPLACAVHALDVVDVRRGRVAILGGGSLGADAVRARRRRRAARRSCSTRIPERLAHARALRRGGDRSSPRAGPRTSPPARAHAGRGAELVIEAVGPARGVGARGRDGRARRHREPVRRLRARHDVHRADRARALRGGDAARHLPPRAALPRARARRAGRGRAPVGDAARARRSRSTSCPSACSTRWPASSVCERRRQRVRTRNTDPTPSIRVASAEPTERVTG